VDQWAYVAAPLFAYGIVVLGLAAWGWGQGGGDRNIVKGFFRSISLSLNRLTGLPGWCMAGALTGLMAAGIAAFGLYWDVAWHIELGRDREVLSPPHLLILTALTGLIGVALLTIATATATGADVRLRRGRWRLPWSALLLLAFRVGGLVAFVLDSLWHDAYGVDVTLLSPPHLGLLASGSLSAVALWLMLAEGRPRANAPPSPPSRSEAGLAAPPGRTSPDAPVPPGRSSPGLAAPPGHSGVTGLGRALHVMTLASVLIGLSTYQAEYDYGVPLFPVVLLPVLVLAAAGLGLTTARLALGPGGALASAVGFLVLRGALAPVIGELGHVMPRTALYLPAAVAIELVAWRFGTRNRLRFALASGALLATVGLAGEWAWASTAGGHHLAVASWPLAATLAAGAAVGAAVLGTALAGSRLPRWVLSGAGALLVVAVAVPTQRQVGRVEAIVAIDRLDGDAVVDVEVRPQDAARSADLFEVWSAQGGGRIQATLREVGPGRYRASRPVPVGGDWKTLVALYRGREVMATPIRLPADPDIGAAEVPAQPLRQADFTPMSKVLLREAHDGPAVTAMAAYATLAILLAVWLYLMARSRTQFRPRPTVAVTGSPP
jgi:hypothetical protein